MKIHLQSDIHLEFDSKPDNLVMADVYVLAGDIGVISNTRAIKDYFNSIKDNCDHIIWVLGNHEFYHSVYEESLEKALSIANECGIKLLDIAFGTQDLEIDGVKFWGTTFWTDLHEHDWFAHKKIQDGLNDFHVIHKKNGRKFTAHESYEINQFSRKLINWDADVIITHHCPTMIPHPKFPLNELAYAFNNTGLEQKIIDSNIKYWLYGHTHHSTVEEYNCTLVVSNQYGYGVYNEQTGYNPNLILEINNE